MKKAIAIMIFALAGMTAVAQTSIWDGSRTVWINGNGTESSPYLIESAQNLAFLAYVVNKGYNTEGMYFRLTTDIDLNGSEDQQWVPIGLGDRWFNEDGCDRGRPDYYGPNPMTIFRGHFDGDEHSISNIYINGGYYVGLFGMVQGNNENNLAVIENVFVTNGYINGSYSGGIAATAYNTLISRCWNGATIEGTNVGGIVGGIAGSNVYKVHNCYNIGNINGKYAGGIVGFGAAEIEECYNEGDVSGTYAGGIYGFSQMKRIIINNCYNTGSISADGEVPSSNPAGPAAGGIVSFIFNGNASTINSTVTNCYNVGSVSSTREAGCIVGYITPNVTLENNYYISSCDAGGEGTALSEDYMRSQEFVDYLNGRNRDQVWALDVDYINDGFPILVEDNLSVEEVAEAAFAVYPNPANGQFTVEGTGTVRIISLMGQVVSTRAIKGQQTFSLPQGMYFVSLNGKTQKIVVE